MEDKILVNDIIKIKSSENVDSYISYDSWFWGYDLLVDNKYGTPLSKHIKTVNESYRCMWAGPHHFTGEQLYAIEGVKSHKIFLIDSNSISTYSHTCGSYDNTAVALSIISKQYNKLLIDLDEARRENDRLALKVAVPCKDSMPENLMPPLEDGMYGKISSNDFNAVYKFVVRNGVVFLDDGRAFNVKEFKGNTLGSDMIVEIITGIGSFNDYDKGTPIWSIFYDAAAIK